MKKAKTQFQWKHRVWIRNIELVSGKELREGWSYKNYLGASSARRLHRGRLKSCLTASSDGTSDIATTDWEDFSAILKSSPWHRRFRGGEGLHATRAEVQVRARVDWRKLPMPPPWESVEQFEEAEDEIAEGEVTSSPSTLLASELWRIRGGRPRRRPGVEGGLAVLALALEVVVVVLHFIPRRTMLCGGKARLPRPTK